MSKRKQRRGDDESDGDEGSDVSIVDVDFEFFDPNPKVDYHAIKRLLVQLFQSDAELVHVADLADLILSQPTVGTTIKTEGIESDPYALLTVLNMHVHQNHPSIKAVTEYVLEKSSTDRAFHDVLQNLLSPTALSQGLNRTKHVGLVICERLVNMPVQVIPPMYRMLTDEVKWAIEDNEPYVFSHLLFISRIYRLSAEDEMAIIQSQSAATPRSKRARKQASTGPSDDDNVYSFHPEDEQIKQLASHRVEYSFTGTQQQPAREKDSFGVDTGGRLMLVPADRLTDLVARMIEVYAVTQQHA